MGEFESVLTPQRKKQLVKIAEATLKKDKRINIHISSGDLEALQTRALEKDIPYQALASNILHSYFSVKLYSVMASGKLNMNARYIARLIA